VETADVVEVMVDGGHSPELVPVVERAIRAALGHQRVSEAEISVALLDDGAIQALNREHLGHDYPADVISFPLWEEGQSILGDIYIGVEQAARQAADAGVSLVEEVRRLAVHGTLHVLGFDHPEDARGRAASEMYRLQESIVASLAEGSGPRR
jgi:probable rRNA maturation factor